MDSSRWNKIVRRVFGIGARIESARFFESKKNQVTLLHLDLDGVSCPAVAKYFVWGDCRREWDVINRAYVRGVPVPRPLGRCGQVIFTGMAPGENGRILCNRNPQGLDFSAMGRWLGLFHRAFYRGDGMTMIKGDLMLPNFIFSPESHLPVGVDFEESRMGDVREDLSHMVATALYVGSPSAGVVDARLSGLMKGYLSEFPLALNLDELWEPVAQRLLERVEYMPHIKKVLLQLRRRVIEVGLWGSGSFFLQGNCRNPSNKIL